MSVYWVNYDLAQPGQRYDALITYLKSHRGWAKVAKSSFFVHTDVTADELLRGALTHLDSTDTITVVKVDGEYWATYGTPSDVVAWMRQSIRP